MNLRQATVPALLFMRDSWYQTELWLPAPPRVVFPFFAEAQNLEAITPPWLRFEIVTPGRIRMARGTRIDYRLRLHGVALRWQSEITAWEPSFRFVDEQRRGPYRFWRHEHVFLEEDGGTLCKDLVQYRVLGGSLVDRLFVRRDVEQIFEFRKRALIRRFTGPGDAAPLPTSAELKWAQ